MTDAVRRRAEEIVSLVIDTMQSPVQGKHLRDWSDVVIEKRRLAAEKVADAVAQAVKEKDEQIEAQVKIIRGAQEAARNALVRARETLDLSIGLFNTALRREPQPAQPPPGPPGGHALQFFPGREPVAFDYGKIGVTCGCGRTPVHSTVDPKFHPEEA
jgi:hypothetical protein